MGRDGGWILGASLLALVHGCARGTATRDERGFDAGRNPVSTSEAGAGKDAAAIDAAATPSLDGGFSSLDAAVDDAEVACEPQLCDDAIACTADTCGSDGGCVFTPIDALCAVGETCSPSAGCLPTPCPESPCALVAPQCGCPIDQGCYPVEPTEEADGLSGEVSCRAVGTRTEGQLCAALLYDCAPGNLCLSASLSEAASVRTCQRVCREDVDCVGSGSRCVYDLSDRVRAVRAVRVCSTACDPIGQSGCATGTYCDIYPSGLSATPPYTDCFGPIVGTGRQGAICTAQPCAPGFRCRGTGSSAVCAAYCLANADCPTNTTCQKAGTSFTVGSTTYGLCQ